MHQDVTRLDFLCGPLDLRQGSGGFSSGLRSFWLLFFKESERKKAMYANDLSKRICEVMYAQASVININPIIGH